MKPRCLILAAGLLLAAGSVSWAFDSIKTTSRTVTGRITKISRTAIEVDRTGISKSVPVNEIVTVYFDQEPTLMKTARAHLITGHYEDALETLTKVKPDGINRPEIEQDLDFYLAFCTARLALGGSGSVKEAGRQMANFLKKHPQSYHYYQASEILGDLAAASGKYGPAETFYARLDETPWPDFKMRANVAIGRARLAQGKTAEALQAFQSVLAMDVPGDLAKSQKLAATLGKARCLAVDKKHDEAIKMVNDVLGNADPEQKELHARAYNVLGTAHREAGQTNEAILAFLHVDLLYFNLPDAHAEALAKLAELWDEVHKTERATQARQTLQERYGNSRWSKQGE